LLKNALSPLAVWAREKEEIDDESKDAHCAGQDDCCLREEVRSTTNAKHRPHIPPAKGAGKTASLAGLHQDYDHQQNADDDLKSHENTKH
jgi:hypothetical protein